MCWYHAQNMTHKEKAAEKSGFFLSQNPSLPFKVMHLFLFLNVLLDSLPINVWKNSLKGR